ncbi:MAG: RNA 3'-terminal phosphate cyclase [Thermodesulfobacteriota bacterium]
MNREILSLDGAAGSGSGTIARDAACFAALTGRAVRLYNIRAKRGKPGLRPQHVKVLQACAEVCKGRLRKAEPGSREFEFYPRSQVRGGEYYWDIGTAGSTTMLLLGVLPLGLLADGPSIYVLRGGLFQDFAPSALHTRHVLMPILTSMGVEASLDIQRPGYVPSGGGCLECTVYPAKIGLRPLSRTDTGDVIEIRGLALSSYLEKRRVSRRMRQACEERLQGWNVPLAIEEINDSRQKPAFREPAEQAGACLAVWARTSTGCLLGSDLAGAPGRPAEKIGQKVADRLIEDLSARACVDRFLADQLVPFAALAKGVSTYRIPMVTDHVETRLRLVEKFFGAQSEIHDAVVSIAGVG